MVKQKSYKVVWDRLALNHFKEILTAPQDFQSCGNDENKGICNSCQKH